MRYAAAALLAIVLVVPAGCSAEQANTTLDAAIVDYDAGRYAEALGHANTAYSRLSGGARRRAAFVAGMSAYRLDRLDESERRLATSAAAVEREVAGRSKAMLGLIRLRQHRPIEAARYYTEASRLLEGEESAQASYQAGLAYQVAGDVSSARAQFIIAAGRGTGTTVRDDATTSLDQTGFTVQVGAFQNAENADRAADEARAIARSGRLGSVRVIERRDERGRHWHLVRVGAFGTRRAAEVARASLPPGSRVVPIGAV